MNNGSRDNSQHDASRDAPDESVHAASHDAMHDGPDAQLAAALRAALPAVPVDDVNWPALHARISAAAEPLLAQSRPSASVRLHRGLWQPLAGWSPFGIPLAAAASVSLLLVSGVLRPDLPGIEAGSAFVTIEEELVNGLSAGARPLLAGADTDAMLDVALFYDGEDWQP